MIVLRVIIASACAVNTFAIDVAVGSYVEVTANRNVRTSNAFKPDLSNLAFVAAKGLKGRVVNVRRFASGNYGVQIQVTSGGSAEGISKTGEKVWVYYRTQPGPSQKPVGSSYLHLTQKSAPAIETTAIENADAAETKVPGVASYHTASSVNESSAEDQVSDILASAGTSTFPLTSDRLPTTVHPSQRDCFEPKSNATITTVLKPRSEWNETNETISQIHELLRSLDRYMDPRLAYYRLIEESGGDPGARNSSGAYGIFQIMGGRKIFEKLQRENPKVSPRLLQVRYYVETFVPRFVAAANAGMGGCGRQAFGDYSEFQKLMYLGWGNCDARYVRKEAQICISAQRDPIRKGACDLKAEALKNHGTAFCPATKFEGRAGGSTGRRIQSVDGE